MKRIHLAVLGALTVSCLAALACVDSTPTDTVSDAGSPPVDATSTTGDSSTVTDSGSKSDAGIADASTFVPTQLAGIALWLDAAKGVTGTANVTTWADQSGNGNDFSQATPRISRRSRPARFRGLPAPQSTSSADDYVSLAPLPASLTFGTRDYGVFEVIEYDNTASSNNDTGYACLWVMNSAGGVFGSDPFEADAAPLYVQMAGVAVVSPAPKINDSNYHYIGARRTSTTLEARADRTSRTIAITGTQVERQRTATYENRAIGDRWRWDSGALVSDDLVDRTGSLRLTRSRAAPPHMQPARFLRTAIGATLPRTR